MLVCNEVYTFVSTQKGVTQDGEKYFAINVIGKNNKRRDSFVTKNGILIEELEELKFVDFQDIELEIRFNKEYNREKKFSYWRPELIGVGKSNRNFE